MSKCAVIAGWAWMGLVATATVARADGGPAPASATGWTASFAGETEFAPHGRNPYFVLEPGYRMVLKGVEDGGEVLDELTVLAATALIDGVVVGVVQDQESKRGKVAELTFDYYALSKRTNGVYYFGEDVTEYKAAGAAAGAGGWRSGVKDAKFGLMMPGVPLVGARYFQEMAPGVGMDQGMIVSVDETVKTSAGTFTHCVRTLETSPLEPGNVETKVYAPGIGVVVDGALQLVDYGFVKPDKKK